MTATTLAYIGSRTNSQRGGRGRGIVVYDVPPQGGWVEKQVVDGIDPSFLTLDRTGRYLYAVQGDGETVSVFGRDQDGRLELLQTCDARGVNGVYATTDPSNRFLLVVNHAEKDGLPGNIAVFPIQADGRLDEATDVHVFDGEPGPHRTEQTGPKPHQVQFSPDGAFLAVPDKGADEVVVLRLDPAGRLLPVEGGRVRLRWGCAPRHLRFNPRLPALHVLNELDSTITTLGFEPATGRIAPIQVVQSQSDDYHPVHRTSEIATSADGRFVYAANRGENSIGVFSVDGETARLRPIQFAPSGGVAPRHFCLSGDGRIYVANEFTHNISALQIEDDGRLTSLPDVAQTPSPTCVVLA